MLESAERSKKSVSVISNRFVGSGTTGNRDPDCFSGQLNVKESILFCCKIFFVFLATFSASLFVFSSSDSEDDDDDDEEEDEEEATEIVWLFSSFSNSFWDFCFVVVLDSFARFNCVCNIGFGFEAGS